MEITEVRIKLMEEPGERLKAFCSITFDDSFVVRDLKIIEGSNGPFVAMPSRRMREACPKCAHRNPVRSNYCGYCGASLEEMNASRHEEAGDGKGQHRDIAHPITQEARNYIQRAVLDAYEKERAKESSVSGGPETAAGAGEPE